MLNKLRSSQGFTLIELLIVVAIIGILAAVAIPQFSSYRQKGFNAAAVADIKNAKTAQEALFADNQSYGYSAGAANLAALAAAVPAAGTLLTGPTPSATATIVGSYLTGNNAAGQGVAAGIGLSNGVVFFSNTPAAPVNQSPTYIMYAKHTQGSREYATETEATAIMFVQNDTWAGTPLTVAGIPANGAGVVVVPTTGQDITGAAGGAPTAAWAAM